jgi:hypothetical protein
LTFWLRLPEGKPEMGPKDRDDFDKSADYLRRWAFDTALQNVDSDVDSLLVPEQRGFFASTGPKRFYQDRKVEDNQRVLQSLISRRLVAIRNLAEPSTNGGQRVSAGRISDCVRQFQSERIGDILAAQCGIDKRKADLFSDHLLTEALLNVKEHPNATVGMVAISLMGNTNELVLSVVDNGDSIPETIYPRFRSDHKQGEKAFIESVPAYRKGELTAAQRAEVAHHATRKGVTRKTGAESVNAGNGLTYIKDDSLDTFRGKFWIYTDGVCLRYSAESREKPEVDEWPFSWRGNLLRIAIPLSKKA